MSGVVAPDSSRTVHGTDLAQLSVLTVVRTLLMSGRGAARRPMPAHFAFLQLSGIVCVFDSWQLAEGGLVRISASGER